jgi:hypothetical protein
MCKSALVVSFIVFGLAAYSHTASACTVSEVVGMVSDGAGNDAIEKACKSRIDDAPRCSFRDVVKFARTDKTASEIDDRCGACERPVCEVLDQSCPIGTWNGRFIVGSDCVCANAQGYAIKGTTACYN